MMLLSLFLFILFLIYILFIKTIHYHTPIISSLQPPLSFDVFIKTIHYHIPISSFQPPLSFEHRECYPTVHSLHVDIDYWSNKSEKEKTSTSSAMVV